MRNGGVVIAGGTDSDGTEGGLRGIKELGLMNCILCRLC
jgi:hypothetical protein